MRCVGHTLSARCDRRMARLCGLSEFAGHAWTYLDPSAFDGGTWSSEHGCVYQFVATAAASLNFSSPAGCLSDQWHATPAVADLAGGALSFRFVVDGKAMSKRGWPAAACSLIDMDDGGMYIRGHASRAHPMDFAAHEWLRAATAWVVRSAMIQWPNGLGVLSPGIPVAPGAPPHYNSFYMRDGFYGVSSGWPLVNSSRHAAYQRAAEYVFARPRGDGILPASCGFDSSQRPACHYGSGPWITGLMCNDTEGAAEWHGCQDLDTSSFAVKLAATVWAGLDAAGRDAWYDAWAPALERSLNATSKSPDGSGLLWSNTSRPQVDCGFQDDEPDQPF